MRGRLVIAALLLLGAIGLAVWALGKSKSENEARPSVRDLATTHYVSADEWLGFYDKSLPPSTGWVLLPSEPEAAPFADATGRDDVITPDVCGECHKDNYSGWRTTAHAKTSREASRATVDGSFEAGSNRLATKDPDLSFEMTAAAAELFQTLSLKFGSQTYTHTERFDIVTGSGHHGQTYLYWHGDRLYQLPVSHFGALDQWVNSPGVYVDGAADFARPIGERCLDCHATWFAKAPDDYNRYDRTNYVLGVSCVRCHGAGRRHVEYHRANPGHVEARFIVHPTRLARGRTNVICAQCHSGIGRLLKPAFTFRPGDPIEEYVELDFEEHSGANEDPHAANQLARLRRSRCYQEDETLSCATCHNPHRFERGNAKLFAKRCMGCHEPEACEMAPRVGPQIKDHCVSCHMPRKADQQTVVKLQGTRLLPQLRDHYIRGWPEATARVLKALGK